MAADWAWNEFGWSRKAGKDFTTGGKASPFFDADEMFSAMGSNRDFIIIRFWWD
jgi:hypothetical protein